MQFAVRKIERDLGRYERTKPGSIDEVELVALDSDGLMPATHECAEHGSEFRAGANVEISGQARNNSVSEANRDTELAARRVRKCRHRSFRLLELGTVGSAAAFGLDERRRTDDGRLAGGCHIGTPSGIFELLRSLASEGRAMVSGWAADRTGIPDMCMASILTTLNSLPISQWLLACWDPAQPSKKLSS